jgi:hypothetical protein
MSKWGDNRMTERVLEVLNDVRLVNEGGHHFGRPFVTSYQIAIEVERRHPGSAAALGKQLGGAGTGTQVSMAQYIGNELSKQIKAEGSAHPVEGRFLSNMSVTSLTYAGPSGPIVSSVTGTGFDLGLFRLRA